MTLPPPPPPPRRIARLGALPLAIALLVARPAALPAQHSHHPTTTPDSTPMAHRAQAGAPLALPMSRTGSGTSWLPDASAIHARHFQAGRWALMLHGVVVAQYDKQSSARGDEQVGSINWAMLMAQRPLGAGLLSLRAMASLEPFTISARGYPLLLQTGESYRGRPLHDRQHPHDLVMELAALYERPLAGDLGISLYAAPVGEPALGPVAYPHRPSAAGDPFAPLSHHWQDATHVTFGVLTVGLFTRTIRLEGSLFNGREPDEHRTDFDYAGRRLDSYAARLTVNPAPRWSLSASYGYLASPEGLHPEESLHRISASVLYSRPRGERGEWASALIWGANEHPAPGRLAHSVLAETTLDLDGRNTIFGRAEYVQKSAEELALDLAPSAEEVDIGTFVLGYVREVGRLRGASMGVGVRGALGVVPGTLEPAYGTRMPAGLAVFVRVRPEPAGMAMP